MTATVEAGAGGGVAGGGATGPAGEIPVRQLRGVDVEGAGAQRAVIEQLPTDGFEDDGLIGGRHDGGVAHQHPLMRGGVHLHGGDVVENQVGGPVEATAPARHVAYAAAGRAALIHQKVGAVG